jgi:hypothetical protein
VINIEGDTATLVFTIKQPVITGEEISSYTLTDPDTLNVALTDPAGATTTYVFGTDAELTRVDTGVYRLVISVPTAGEWDATITATNPDVYDEQAFMVGESQTWTVVPPLSDYELFTGAAATSYSAMALDQAQLLLQLATGISARPTDPTALRVYRFGIFAMAEALENSQTTRSIAFSPFRVEEIGSYRYERGRTDVRAGIPTGILWFDMAVDYFNGLVDSSLYDMHTSMSLFEVEDSLVFTNTQGRRVILGPADRAAPNRFDQYALLRVYGTQIGPD